MGKLVHNIVLALVLIVVAVMTRKIKKPYFQGKLPSSVAGSSSPW